MSSVKKDCFAYDSKNKKCSILNDTFCRKEEEECNFYKSLNQYTLDRKRYDSMSVQIKA